MVIVSMQMFDVVLAAYIYLHSRPSTSQATKSIYFRVVNMSFCLQLSFYHYVITAVYSNFLKTLTLRNKLDSNLIWTQSYKSKRDVFMQGKIEDLRNQNQNFGTSAP